MRKKGTCQTCDGFLHQTLPPRKLMYGTWAILGQSSPFSLWHLSDKCGQWKISRCFKDVRERIPSGSDVNRGQEPTTRLVREVRLPIQCGNVAKWEHSSISRVWRVLTCWLSSSGTDFKSDMLEIRRDSNGEAVVDNINCRSTSSLTLANCSVLRQGNEDTCKDVSSWHFQILNQERRGDKCSSKDAKLGQNSISKRERLGDGGSSKDVNIWQ